LFCFGRGKTTLSWGETTLSWGETTVSWGETTLNWGEMTWGETDLGRNDRNNKKAIYWLLFKTRVQLARCRTGQR